MVGFIQPTDKRQFAIATDGHQRITQVRGHSGGVTDDQTGYACVTSKGWVGRLLLWLRSVARTIVSDKAKSLLNHNSAGIR